MARAVRMALCACALWAGAVPAGAQEQMQTFDPTQIFGGGGSGSFEKVRAVHQSFVTDDKGDLVRYSAEGKFVYRSKDFNLDCDSLVYEAAKDLLVATGTPCKIVQGEQYAECRKFEYTAKDGRMVMTGSPFIRRKMGEKTTESRARKISFVRTPDGYTNVILEGAETVPAEAGKSAPPKPAASAADKNAVISVKEAPAQKKTKPAAPPKPVRIEEGKLDKIPVIDVDE